ncbi:UDP-N-acetylglucosamine/UDP-glucose/GDP-mannose transporter isoform X1 [Arapaima gigas]
MNSVCRSGGGRTRLKHLAPRARGDEGLRTGGERRRGAYEAPLPLSSASAPKMNDLAPPPGDQPSPLLRFLSAAFYAASSFFIVLVNKVVLTQYSTFYLKAGGPRPHVSSFKMARESWCTYVRSSTSTKPSHSPAARPNSQNPWGSRATDAPHMFPPFSSCPAVSSSSSSACCLQQPLDPVSCGLPQPDARVQEEVSARKGMWKCCALIREPPTSPSTHVKRTLKMVADWVELVPLQLVQRGFRSKKNQNIHFQDFDRSIFYKIFPLPLLYVGNHITGLASTKKLSLPMFTVLRKFTILMTMVLESRILRKSFPLHLICSVLAIVFGALVAASSDLAFDLEGYTFILLNDLCTAASGVYTKKKLGVEGLGKYGVIFYNACIIVVPTLLASLYTGDLKKVMAFEFWLSFMFVFYFLVSCIMGFILMYSVMLCSHYNSALTTTVIGAIKNVAVAYIGMFVGGDYVFSWMNFIGLNICMLGGLTYSYLTFRSSSATERFDHSRAEGPKDTESLAEPNKQREKQPLAVGDGLPDSMCG